MFRPHIPKLTIPGSNQHPPIIWQPDWDLFQGTPKDDWYAGGSGNDVMLGSLGADHFYGGADSDTVNYSNSGYGGVSLDLGRGYGWAGLADGDTYRSVENVIGTAFDDYIAGSSADNYIWAGNGDDTVIITGGSDTLNGGGGTDKLVGWTDKITVNLATGTGSYGIADGDTYTGFENVSLTGTENTVIGDAGANGLRVLGEFATIDGGDGDDTLEAAAWGGSLDGGAGTDTLTLLDAGLISGIGAPSGTGVHIDLDGGEAYVKSVYHAPVQTISNIENVFGTDGDDTFIENTDDNLFAGAGGADLFVFEHNSSGQRDQIKDFQGGVDRIDLSASDVRSFNDLFNGGPRRAEQVGSDTVIFTGSDNEILLQGVTATSLTVDDFVF